MLEWDKVKRKKSQIYDTLVPMAPFEKIWGRLAKTGYHKLVPNADPLGDRGLDSW